ncbi:nulp1-pending protein [Ophiostoma piceae UAMH 11346]|uniref:Nulp1-pending protein n=1 Tax=Ophiostoma piceae (strain UAMH 11346) TaxID=1262450 RepID=S3CKU4_OPHP1|nr:nulp1-pending protein [Ophiostoma piceae UAMH 11346]
MSSRQIKKLRAQEELARKAAAKDTNNTNDETGAHSDSDESEDEIDIRPARPKNAFAAFAALEQEEEENGEEEEEEDGVPEEAAPEPIPKAAASKKKKKKNKKGKKGAKEEEQEEAAATSTLKKAANGKGKDAQNKNTNRNGKGKDLDEIDRALEELSLQNKSGAAAYAPGTALATPPQHRIRIELHNLRVLNELRDVFGNEVLATAHAQEQAGGPANPRARGERLVNVDLETFFRAPAQGYTHRGLLPSSAGLIAKRNPFIQWKDTWPRATSGGLSMAQVGKPDAFGVTEFAFVHGSEYIGLEEQFQTMTLLAHADTNMLFNFLKQFPFHIASLIVVSIFARTHDQNPTLAADLLERALFSFGRATLSSFRTALTDAQGGKARLSFQRPENRQFVLVGYHYIRSLMGRGTFRTALEWIKVFLSLMPRDDYGLLLYAQSAAVQAYESRWFVDYISTFEKASGDNVWPMLEYIRQSVVPAKLQLKDTDGARTALQDGVNRVPWLYGALFQALNLDVPRAVWAVLPRDDVETLYTELYLDVAKALWSPAVMDFVKAEITAMAKPDVAKIPGAFPVTQTIARFVYLGNTPALMGLVVPKALLHTQPNSDFDPLPPKRDDNLFSYPSQQRPWAIAEEESRPSQGNGQSPYAGVLAAAMAAVAAGGGPDAVDAAAAAAGEGGEGGVRGWLDFLRGVVGGAAGGGELDPAILEAMEEELIGYDEEGDDEIGEPELLEADDVTEEPHPATSPLEGGAEEEDEDEHAPRGNMPGGWFD